MNAVVSPLATMFIIILDPITKCWGVKIITNYHPSETLTLMNEIPELAYYSLVLS